VIFATPILAEVGSMVERDLTAREDRLVGLCLVAAAIILVFMFVATYS
jgi:hypothetical protein